MRNHALAGAALLFGLAVDARPGAGDARADGGSARDTCVVYSETSHEDTRSLDVHLANTCSKPSACRVSWTVVCGKARRLVQNSAVLGGNTERVWVASAAPCPESEDWSIDTSWGCNTAGAGK